jgi:peptide/nickel transport system substrate-binding protein
MEETNVGGPPAASPFDRRNFLKLLGAGGAALTAAPLLSACASSSTAQGTATGTAGAPKRGGTLTAGLSGGNSSDSLNPLNPVNNTDYVRVAQLFDPLVQYTVADQPQLYLAEELTPNSNATEWVIRVRRGVTFHSGKDLTADDVIYTFQQVFNPKSPGESASSLGAVDVSGIKKLDNWTVRVPCKTPFSVIEGALSGFYIIPADFDVHNPVGTGPFKFKSFTAGEQSAFDRNDSYWVPGLPYVDSLVLNDFADETSQVNALVSGQADIINLLSTESIALVRSSGNNIVISPGSGWTPFTMRVDTAPFSDVRVRRAMQLIVDRPQMLELVFKGYGTIGNDLFSIWDPAYNHALPQRHQDLEQAKSLLKQAGHEGLTTTLVTGPIAQGTVQAAEVFAQQAKGAGVTVNLKSVNVTEFYGPNYLKWVFAQDYWYSNPFFDQVGSAMLPSSPFNETHYNDPQYISLYKQALATVDVAKRTEIAHEMQAISYSNGGYIIPYFAPIIEAHSPKVHGDVPSKSGESFNRFDLKTFWLS